MFPLENSVDRFCTVLYLVHWELEARISLWLLLSSNSQHCFNIKLLITEDLAINYYGTTHYTRWPFPNWHFPTDALFKLSLSFHLTLGHRTGHNCFNVSCWCSKVLTRRALHFEGIKCAFWAISVFTTRSPPLPENWKFVETGKKRGSSSLWFQDW